MRICLFKKWFIVFALNRCTPVGFEWKAFDSNFSLHYILYPVPLLAFSKGLAWAQNYFWKVAALYYFFNVVCCSALKLSALRTELTCSAAVWFWETLWEARWMYPRCIKTLNWCALKLSDSDKLSNRFLRLSGFLWLSECFPACFRLRCALHARALAIYIYIFVFVSNTHRSLVAPFVENPKRAPLDDYYKYSKCTLYNCIYFLTHTGFLWLWMYCFMALHWCGQVHTFLHNIKWISEIVRVHGLYYSVDDRRLYCLNRLNIHYIYV